MVGSALIFDSLLPLGLGCREIRVAEGWSFTSLRAPYVAPYSLLRIIRWAGLDTRIQGMGYRAGGLFPGSEPANHHQFRELLGGVAAPDSGFLGCLIRTLSIGIRPVDGGCRRLKQAQTWELGIGHRRRARLPRAGRRDKDFSVGLRVRPASEGPTYGEIRTRCCGRAAVLRGFLRAGVSLRGNRNRFRGQVRGRTRAAGRSTMTSR